MQQVQQNLFTRQDTFFGVCQGLGEDLGFHPNILRVGFAPLLYFSWQAAIGLYLGLGLLVLATRLLVPNPRLTVSRDVEAAPAPAQVEPFAEEQLPIAA